MRRFDGLAAVRDRPDPAPVTTIGVFDGVHRGHREILRRVRQLADRLGGSPWMITFATHPDRLVTGEAPPAITSLDQRLELLAEAGMKNVWVLSFDEEMRELEAEAFVSEVLVGRLGVRGVVLGEDARFGKGGRGTVGWLAECGPRQGFEVESVPVLRIGGAAVSSTRIRQSVVDGKLGEAARLLGRPFSLRGIVRDGDGRGRRIGVPTANLAGPFPLLPPDGVYLTEAVVGDRRRFAVTNVGRRPTFDGGTPGPDHVSVETHLLDFEGDLRGMTLEVRLLERLREERRFEDADALVTQIRRDIERARHRAEDRIREVESGLTPQSGEL